MNINDAKFKAIKYIGISKKTEYEVISKLKECKFEEYTIQKVVNYLKELGYIDDSEYVRAFIRQNERACKYSILEIKQKLILKGIKKDIIDFNLSKLYNSNYEKEVISKIYASKFSNGDKIKFKSYIFRRGFGIDNKGEFE